MPGHFPLTHNKARVVGLSFSLKTRRKAGTACTPSSRIFSISGCDQRSEIVTAESLSRAGCITLTVLCRRKIDAPTGIRARSNANNHQRHRNHSFIQVPIPNPAHSLEASLQMQTLLLAKALGGGWEYLHSP